MINHCINGYWSVLRVDHNLCLNRYLQLMYVTVSAAHVVHTAPKHRVRVRMTTEVRIRVRDRLRVPYEYPMCVANLLYKPL